MSVVSTDITGPRGFMKKYGGSLVENSQKTDLKCFTIMRSKGLMLTMMNIIVKHLRNLKALFDDFVTEQ